MITSQDIEHELALAYIHAICARAGFNSGRDGLDYGVDGTIKHVQYIDGRRVDSGHPIDYQAKSSVGCTLEKSHIVYDLEAKTYNDMVERNGRKAVPLILILLNLPADPLNWIGYTEDELMLRSCCYWAHLKGTKTTNSSSIRIRIRRSQTFTPDAVKKLYERVKRGTLR